MIKKTIVLYLHTCFESFENLLNFKNNYLKYDSGFDHELVICYKLVDQNGLDACRSVTEHFKHTEFIDNSDYNDFDLGSYYRVSSKYKNTPIFFMNGYSSPIKQKWLNTLMKFYNNKTLIGTTGSYESISSNLKFKKILKNLDFFNFLKNYFFIKNNFPKKPNPHLRSPNFLINSDKYIEFINYFIKNFTGKNVNFNKVFNSKAETWIAESGKISMTNYFKKKNYKVLVVNSDEECFEENNWKNSSTYNFNNQEKLLVIEKHSKRYLTLNNKEKIKSEKKIW